MSTELITDKEAQMRLAQYCLFDDEGKPYFDATGLIQDFIVISIAIGKTKEDMLEVVEACWADIKEVHNPGSMASKPN